MFRNYVITALRNFTRHKLYSFINVAGLAVGLACVLFILLFLRDELSYDGWIRDSQSLYRLSITFTGPRRPPDFNPYTPFPLSVAMRDDFPEVVGQTHLIPENMTAEIKGRQFPVSVAVVDPNFLQLIQLELVKGDSATALIRPESLVLSETAAKKFFGTDDAIGKSVTLGGSHTLTVTGILRDLPHNTHLSVDAMMPNTSAADAMPASSPERVNWLNVWGSEYIKLAPGADVNAVTAKLPALLDRHLDFRKQMHIDMRASQVLHVHLTPFGRVHLAPLGETRDGKWGNFYGFAAIAALILLIAGINYMNLATARAITRAGEVSLRKVLGARRVQLILQFLGESLIVALAALVLAVALVEITLPVFEKLLAKPVTYQVLADWRLTLIIFGVAMLAGLLGGFYPAMVLSGFRPAAGLRNSAWSGGGAGFLRMALVVVQFAVSIGLGIAVIVISAQIEYARRVELGFDRHNVVVLGGAGTLTPSVRDTLVHMLAGHPAIAAVAQSDSVPFDGTVRVANVTPAGAAESVIDHVTIDPNFLKLYGMKIVAGRNLDRGRGGDTLREPGTGNPNPAANVLINEAAARQFGFTAANAVGKNLTMQGVHRLTVVGVVADANFYGPRSAVGPVVYYYQAQALDQISVRMKVGQTTAALAAIDQTWHHLVPNVAIERHFEEARFDLLFSNDERQGHIFSVFVGIAIFIACLGLFGLASFMTVRRTREMAIRKTYGARGREIVSLLVWQFSLPVLIANAIAWPVAWYYLQRWLESYATRITLTPVYFLEAGAAALIIAWITVIGHAARMARAHPVHALRYE